MIDYAFLGAQIRAARREKKLTQEQLAEAAGVGVTHICHIETGNSVPSLQTFVSILNALHCSADALLCLELTQAAPARAHWFDALLADCTDDERSLIVEMTRSLKAALRRRRET